MSEPYQTSLGERSFVGAFWHVVVRLQSRKTRMKLNCEDSLPLSGLSGEPVAATARKMP